MIIEAEAVVFDSDGVLVDSHSEVMAAWSQVCEEFGLETDTVLSELAGVRAADTLGRYLSGDRLVAAVARLEGIEMDLAPATKPVPGAIELLAGLPAQRWTIATSASSRLANGRWAGAGIVAPPNVVTAEDVERGKPHPDPYLVAANRLGVAPAGCIVFEDSPSGGLAGRDAGAVVVAVGRGPWAFEPAVRVSDLRSVSVIPNQNGVTLSFD